jgi:hypothetical protein
MPANDQKIVSIMFSEIEAIDERCDGYRDQLKVTVSDIIAFVREHKINRTNVDQKVADKISATGRFLDDVRKESKKERKD